MKTIRVDLQGLKAQLEISDEEIDQLTQTSVDAVSAEVYANWEAAAKQRLKSTLPEYLQNLNLIDKGRFNKSIVLSGVLPNMLEQGATAFDMKEGFKKSEKVRYTIPVYNRKGEMISPGGDWYLTIPFRIGTPGALGQAGFSAVMPQEVYDVIRRKPAGNPLKRAEIPEPYDIPSVRPAIYSPTNSNPVYSEYVHKSSIFEGMTKRTAPYAKTTQNTYGTFRRAGANSDPLSWIHKGIQAYNLADEAIKNTDVETTVGNLVTDYLNERI